MKALGILKSRETSDKIFVTLNKTVWMWWRLRNQTHPESQQQNIRQKPPLCFSRRCKRWERFGVFVKMFCLCFCVLEISHNKECFCFRCSIYTKKPADYFYSWLVQVDAVMAKENIMLFTPFCQEKSRIVCTKVGEIWVWVELKKSLKGRINFLVNLENNIYTAKTGSKRKKLINSNHWQSFFTFAKKKSVLTQNYCFKKNISSH